MGFEYEIIDDEVTITHLKDRSITSILIPEFIDGYPVTNITLYALDGQFLSNVNGYDIIDNPLIINNKFILYRGITYKIKHNIGNNYIAYFIKSCNHRYFIDDILYNINLKAVYS